MKRIKIFAITLAIMITGLIAIGVAGGSGDINWGHAGAVTAFLPLAFVKKLKDKGVYDKLDADTKAFIDTLDTELAEAFKEARTGLMDEKTFTSRLEAEVAKIKQLPEGFDEAVLKKMKDDLEAEITGFIEFQKEYNAERGNGPQVSKSLEQAIMDACEEKEVKEQIKFILDNNGKQNGPLRIQLKGFHLKDAVTIMDSNTILAAGSASHYSLTSNTGLISAIRKRILTYLQNVMVGKLDIRKPYAMWIEELDEQGTPIFIAEGAAKTQLSVRYEEREKKAKKIAVYSKVTTEFLRYLPQLVSYVQNNLMKRMDIKTEDQLFTGDDTGENLKGIKNYATQFDGGKGVANGTGLVGLVHNPTYSDVVRAVALQVQNSYGTPTTLWVSTDAMGFMDTQKASDSGVYMLPPFRSADGTLVAGMRLIPTTALAGTGIDFIGGDTSVINVSFLESPTIQIGLDGNDFTNNKKTILLEQELVQFVSANDTQVLIKGTFQAAQSLISTGS